MKSIIKMSLTVGVFALLGMTSKSALANSCEVSFTAKVAGTSQVWEYRDTYSNTIQDCLSNAVLSEEFNLALVASNYYNPTAYLNQTLSFPVTGFLTFYDSSVIDPIDVTPIFVAGEIPEHAQAETMCTDDVISFCQINTAWNPTGNNSVIQPTRLSPFTLYAGSCLNGNGVRLCMQSDGNLVVYNLTSYTYYWAASGQPGYLNGANYNVEANSKDPESCLNAPANKKCFAAFQGDGNLVLYNPNKSNGPYGSAYWATMTNGNTFSSVAISTAGVNILGLMGNAIPPRYQ